jgi:cellulose synthase/poly-beta-1,6-N-acetylglucosamine synthase-like glycosyltransferase
VAVLNDASRQGKGYAVKHGLEHAFGALGADAVLIVDADSTVSPNVTESVSRWLMTAPVLQCRDQVRNTDASWRTRLMSLAFTGMNVIRPRGRDRLGLSCGIFGNGFAVRREVLDDVGYTVHSIVEDLEFHLVLVDHGYRVRFVEEAAVLADMPISGIDAASQRSRWEGGRLRLLSDWGLKLLGGALRGKILLLEPLIDLLSLPLALEVLTLLLLLLFPGRLARSYAALGFGVILFHLFVVIQSSPDRRGSLRALLASPLYLFWRVAMIPSIVRASRSGAAWIRTHRDSSSR